MEQSSPSFHVILACRDISKAEAAKTSLLTNPPNPIHGQISTLTLDVTSESSVTSAAKDYKAQYGDVLDILINNAGVANTSSSVTERFNACLTTNVIGPALVSDAFRPFLLASSADLGKTSVYVSSSLGSIAEAIDANSPMFAGTMYASFPNIDAYNVSKAALNMLAMQERGAFADKGLKVYTMCPGLVKSNIRGTSEQEVSAGGNAGDPRVSGETILGIIKGDRAKEGEKGIVHKDGVRAW